MDLQNLINEAMQNPVFSGVAGGAIVTGAVGWVVFQAKNLPLQLWRLLKNQFTVTLTVYSDYNFFYKISALLAKSEDARKARRLAMATRGYSSAAGPDSMLGLGDGLHLIKLYGRRMLVRKSSTKTEEGSTYQTLTITALGRSRKVFERMMKEAAKADTDDKTIAVRIAGHSDLGQRRKRALDTVYLKSSLKSSVVNDLKRFLDAEDSYHATGIPWRRGYLLEGPPGTGKTSLVFALASMFNKSITIVNPASVSGDNGLHNLINSNPDSFVLIEDIDAFSLTQKRKPAVDEDGDTIVAAETNGPTISGLLNAIDGVGAAEGRVLFMTTNHPDKIDPALLRPGRVDMRLHIGLLGEEEARQMCRKIKPDMCDKEFVKSIAHMLPMSGAELQNRILSE